MNFSISEKDRKMLIFFAMFLIAVLYYVFFLKGYIAKIYDLKQKNIELKSKLSDYEKVYEEFNANKEKIEEVQNNYIFVSNKLPTNQDEKFSIDDSMNIASILDTTIGDFTISKKQDTSKENEEKKEDKLFYYSLKFNWQLSHDNLKKLLYMAKDYDVAYSVDNLMIVPDNLGNINTSFEMKFYGFKDEDAPVRTWERKKGVSNLDKGGGKIQKDDLEYIDSKKDFLILLSTLNSPTSAITLEKSGTGVNVFGANKSIENVEMNFKGKNGKYSYSMKTEDKVYPTDGYENFTPNTEDIILYVSSQPRKYDDDKNKVVINIYNDTDKKIRIFILNDDEKLPRASVVSNGKSVYVQKR